MLWNKNAEHAREAWNNQDIEESKKIHENVNIEEHQSESGKLIKSISYGGLDGILTIFAVVTGVVGARLDAIIVIVLGIATLLADGLAMGIGDYLSTRAEMDYKKDERQREGWEVKHFPDGEKAEMIEIYMKRGLSKEEAVQVVDIFSKHEKTWVDVMMLEELHLVEDGSPAKNGIITFISFVIFGFIPLISYVIMAFVPGGSAMPLVTFTLAIIATGATLFILGAMKSRITRRGVLRSGLETLLIGGGTALLSYVVGSVLDLLIHFNV